MLGLGPIAFAAPWALAALIVLPVIWWLLRVTPPAPRLVRFPAIRLLRDLVAKEETPARTPLWLLILRLVVAALVILALSQPLLNPSAGMPGSGPVILVVDNGWAAGRQWLERQRAMDDALDQAQRQGREVIVLATAPAATGERPTPSGRLRPAEARRLVQTLQPQPWPTDRAAAAEALKDLKLSGTAHSLWLSDGLEEAGARALADRLRQFGGVDVLADTPDRLARLILPP
ncbi:MAG TPA: BatA domain-containing protein, partial [Azospirillaceae bacterium]|nr:BatA domain-containing protein [Azospirillaceae bacterium]